MEKVGFRSTRIRTFDKSLVTRTYLMFEGSILKDGKPEDLAKDKVVRKVYLGQNFIFRKNRFENI